MANDRTMKLKIRELEHKLGQRKEQIDLLARMANEALRLLPKGAAAALVARWQKGEGPVSREVKVELQRELGRLSSLNTARELLATASQLLGVLPIGSSPLADKVISEIDDFTGSPTTRSVDAVVANEHAAKRCTPATCVICQTYPNARRRREQEIAAMPRIVQSVEAPADVAAIVDEALRKAEVTGEPIALVCLSAGCRAARACLAASAEECPKRDALWKAPEAIPAGSSRSSEDRSGCGLACPHGDPCVNPAGATGLQPDPSAHSCSHRGCACNEANVPIASLGPSCALCSHTAHGAGGCGCGAIPFATMTRCPCGLGAVEPLGDVTIGAPIVPIDCPSPSGCIRARRHCVDKADCDRACGRELVKATRDGVVGKMQEHADPLEPLLREGHTHGASFLFDAKDAAKFAQGLHEGHRGVNKATPEAFDDCSNPICVANAQAIKRVEATGRAIQESKASKADLPPPSWESVAFGRANPDGSPIVGEASIAELEAQLDPSEPRDRLPLVSLDEQLEKVEREQLDPEGAP